MSSERRVIRPYSGTMQFKFVVDSWKLQCGSEEIRPGENLLIRSDSYRTDPISIVCAPDDETLSKSVRQLREACETIGVGTSQVEVLVVASTPYLRLADIVHQKTLDSPEALAVRIPITPVRARALHAPVSGCDVTAYVCLAEDIEPAPLRPHRRGTWLARVDFRLRTDLGEIGFTPRPLTDDLREELDLDPRAMRYVQVDPSALLDEQLDDAVELFVDEDLLGHLNRAAQTPASRSFQRQLFVDVVGAVAHAVSARDDANDLALTDIEGSVLERLIDAYTGKRDSTKDSPEQHRSRREHALQTIVETPGVFVANFEGRLGDPKDDLAMAIGGVA